MIDLPEVNTENYSKYISDISKFPLLTDDKAKIKLILSSIGDEESFRELFDSHARFVVSIAKHYSKEDVEIADLINAGNLGLKKAIKNYYKGYSKKSFMRVLFLFAFQEINEKIKTIKNK